jgi:AcrR family transcriptional regulator
MILTKSRNTVAKILAAAQELFLEKNYADVTMDRIAQAAAVTKGALYHHFASKEELYLALLHRDLDEKREVFRSAVDSSGSALDRLRRLTRAFFELPAPKRELIRLIRRDVNVFRDPVRADLIRAYRISLPDPVERILRDGIRDGELVATDPRLLAWSFIALVEVFLSGHAAQVFPDMDSRLDHVMNLFFGGAAAPRPGAIP